MWSINGDLDPESGHVVDTTVRALADPGNLDPDDRRSPGQRRADAVTEVCRFWLDHNDTATTSAGTKPHITVTVDYEQLADDNNIAKGPDIRIGMLPEIDGTPVTSEDARRLACDADIVRIITKGSSEVLDVGRATRTVPSAIRRAVEYRDRGCTWDGCDAPTSWCDAHHIEHWAHGGPTSLDNLRLLCRHHHRAMHDSAAHSEHGTERARPPDP
jgi:hypothetical protein